MTTMHPVQALLSLIDSLGTSGLIPDAFSAVCVAAGWPRPRGDGIGLWEASDPVSGTPVILDTITKPTTLICRLECDDQYEPEALLGSPLRARFDSIFTEAASQLSSHFPEINRGHYAAPYDWQFVHFEGPSALVALEQTHYDPEMGVQLVLLVQQPRPANLRSAITVAW